MLDTRGDRPAPVGVDIGLAERRGDVLTRLAALFELRLLDPARIGRDPDLCGYVLANGDGAEQALPASDPLLPVESEQRLHDDALRDSFIARVHTRQRWQRLQRDGLTHGGLQRFHASHKYLVMAHCVQSYRALGRLLADGGGEPLQPLADRALALIMAALAKPATRRGHANALEHVRGYLKRRLGAAEQAELSGLIARYRAGAVPLDAPLALLRRHFRRHPDAYVERQVYLQLHPDVPPADAETPA